MGHMYYLPAKPVPAIPRTDIVEYIKNFAYESRRRSWHDDRDVVRLCRLYDVYRRE